MKRKEENGTKDAHEEKQLNLKKGYNLTKQRENLPKKPKHIKTNHM
jgi:hypothetical protein